MAAIDRNESERMIAYHEAGHIVAGHALGLQTKGVTIVAEEHKAGCADIPVELELFYDLDEGKDYVERQLVCYLAGAVAEELLTGESVEFKPGGAYTEDWNGAADCVLELVGYDEAAQSEVSTQAFDKAKEVLGDNWATVEILADALLTYRTLNREGVVKIIEGGTRA